MAADKAEHTADLDQMNSRLFFKLPPRQEYFFQIRKAVSFSMKDILQKY